MRIDDNKLLEIRARVGVIKKHAQDRSVITDECDEISKIIKGAIEDGIQRG